MIEQNPATQNHNFNLKNVAVELIPEPRRPVDRSARGDAGGPPGGPRVEARPRGDLRRELRDRRALNYPSRARSAAMRASASGTLSR